MQPVRIIFQIERERSIHILQALVMDDATEGEEELQAQLAGDPGLPAACVPCDSFNDDDHVTN